MEKLGAATVEKKYAETLIKMKDYKGARSKLLKAKDIFPALENISAMLTACNILCAANSKLIGGRPDWYWVLQTNVNADESQVISKYQKLTTLLQPIKNKFAGTESALSLIHDAFAVLSDQVKRSAFDLEKKKSMSSLRLPNVNDMSMAKKVTPQSSPAGRKVETETLERRNRYTYSREFGLNSSQDASADPCVTEGRMSNSPVGLVPKVSNRRGKGQLVSATMKTSGSELMEKPVGNNKLVFGSSCRSTFTVLNCRRPDPHYYDFENNTKSEVFVVGQIWAAYDLENMPRIYARIYKIGYPEFRLSVTLLNPAPITSDEKRWCEVGLPVACGHFHMARNNMVLSERKAFSHVISHVKDLKEENVEVYPKKAEVWAVYDDWQPFNWCSDPKSRRGCQFLTVEVLKGYSKNEDLVVAPLKRVTGFTSIFQRCVENGRELSLAIPANHLFRFSHNVPAFRFVGVEQQNICNGMLELDPLAVPCDLVDGMADPSEKGNSSDCSSLTVNPSSSPPIVSNQETISMESKWLKKDFISEHIWAVYDGPHLMPRRYVRVKNIISETKVQAMILEPNPMLGDESHWVEENLPFVCGLFRAGKIMLSLDMSLFSHLVTCERSTTKSLYRIFPKKGEIWAMYKNWNATWKQSDYNCCQCQIVEILTDLSEAAEIRIASLVEVTGHMTFFQRQLRDHFELTRTVSRMEMLSFSHQIPCFVVPGAETYGIPEGALHLEPDGLPPNLAN